jgi:hypothetical protein
MSRKLELLLREWGQFHIKHADHADEWGENTLYRAGVMGGKVQYKSDGHKILCPDTPRHLQKVDILLKRLPIMEALAIKLHYCTPLREDGHPYTDEQLALRARMGLTAFNNNLKSGRRSLKRLGL